MKNIFILFLTICTWNIFGAEAHPTPPDTHPLTAEVVDATYESKKTAGDSDDDKALSLFKQLVALSPHRVTTAADYDDKVKTNCGAAASFIIRALVKPSQLTGEFAGKYAIAGLRANIISRDHQIHEEYSYKEPRERLIKPSCRHPSVTEFYGTREDFFAIEEERLKEPLAHMLLCQTPQPRNYLFYVSIEYQAGHVFVVHKIGKKYRILNSWFKEFSLAEWMGVDKGQQKLIESESFKDCGNGRLCDIQTFMNFFEKPLYYQRGFGKDAIIYVRAFATPTDLVAQLQHKISEREAKANAATAALA